VIAERANNVSLLVGHSNLQSFYRMGSQTTTQYGAALQAWSLGYKNPLDSLPSPQLLLGSL
jgi:hypothetical protein